MNITFRQLKLFAALAETGSVSAAAKMLHVTQPTASMQLKEITDAVGLPLYEVISRKVYLTKVGEELANTARNIANEWDGFEQIIASTKGLAVGNLKLAVVSTAKYFIPRFLGNFCSRYPAIEISLEVLNRDGVIARLNQNLDDLYIMSMPPNHLDINDEILMENPLVVIADNHHPLTQASNIALNDLKNERFILREKGSGTRMSCDMFFKEKSFAPQIRLELGSNEAIKEAVASGMGISVVSAHSLNKNAKESDVTVLQVEGFPIHSQWHIVTLKRKKLSPIAQIFHDHLVNEAKAN